MKELPPFNNKYRLECECSACNSKYKIIYFEDDVSGPMIVCPFCMEQTDEFSETNEYASKEIKEDVNNFESETLYTDDEEAAFENDLINDDEYGEEDSEK